MSAPLDKDKGKEVMQSTSTDKRLRRMNIWRLDDVTSMVDEAQELAIPVTEEQKRVMGWERMFPVFYHHECAYVVFFRFVPLLCITDEPGLYGRAHPTPPSLALTHCPPLFPSFPDETSPTFTSSDQSEDTSSCPLRLRSTTVRRK